jgi:hypothetical protein
MSLYFTSLNGSAAEAVADLFAAGQKKTPGTRHEVSPKNSDRLRHPSAYWAGWPVKAAARW